MEDVKKSNEVDRFTKISRLLLDILGDTQFLKSIKIPNIDETTKPILNKIKKDYSLVNDLIINFVVDPFGTITITLTFYIRGVPSTEATITASNSYFEVYIPRALIDDDEVFDKIVRNLEEHRDEIIEALDKMVLKNMI